MEGINRSNSGGATTLEPAPSRRWVRARLFEQVGLAAVLFVLTCAQAQAATFRYSATSNRIYVEGGGPASLTAIKTTVPEAPLDLVDAANKVWMLRADLYIEDGSSLLLKGSEVGGDVNELRLQSNNSSAPGSYVAITADYGNLHIEKSKVTSWNMATNSPDTEHITYGRAFIRVRSEVALDGATPLESRMDIIDSEIAYLGFPASESYGLSWKVTGDNSDGTLFDRVQVRGDILRSKLHHNYNAAYTVGLQDANWVGNEVYLNDDNGLDAHEETDNLLVEDNFIHRNGYHGIVVGKRSDGVTIRNNRANANAAVGIMLQRASTGALVVSNEANNNLDAGIGLVATTRNAIRSNRVFGNTKAGIKISLGSANNKIERNNIGENKAYGIYAYKGTDVPEPGDDGRPKNNQIIGNQIHDNQGEGIRMFDTLNIMLRGNTIQRNAKTLLTFLSAEGLKFQGNRMQVGVTVRLNGTPTALTNALFKGQGNLRLSFDDFATARIVNLLGQTLDVVQAVSSRHLTNQSFMDVSKAILGSTSAVVSKRNMVVKPAAGSVDVDVTLYATIGDHAKYWKAASTDGAAAVAYTVKDMAPGVTYGLYKGSLRIDTVTADPNGVVSFSIVPGTTTELNYSLAAP